MSSAGASRDHPEVEHGVVPEAMTNFSSFEVPPQARRPYRALAQLSEADAFLLAEALEMPGQLATAPELIARVRERVPGLRPMIAALVFSTLALIGNLGQELDEVGLIVEAISEDPAFEDLDAPQRGQLARRLEGLIKSPCLRLAAKAVDIRTAYEHVFADARVLTDVRPVFSDTQGDVPAAGVVVDTLKLDYYGPDGNRRSFYVALDQEDLLKLGDQVARGLTKSKAMRAVLESANLATWKDEWDATD